MTKYRFDLASFPLRETPSHKSQMVSEILYGEEFYIIERKNTWLQIKLDHDGYRGWIEREDVFTESETAINSVCNKVHRLKTKSGFIYLSVGARLTEEENSHFSNNSDLESIVLSFLNTSYLWGGRSFGGIDCSGFSQVCFATQGISLPRDAYQQAEIGNEIPFGKHRFGDLAFFSNKGNNITHVGIILENNQIIHACEKVRIDQLHETGIYRTSLNKQTHKLALIKRVF